MSNGVIYGRISDDPTGKAAGVERQVDECRALATRAGVTIVEELVDNDRSATTGKRRPGFDRVLELVRSGSVDTVVIWHTDRLYRLPRDLEPIIELADDRPLRFLTVTSSEIDLNTASGRMVARILAAASAQEVEHKVERQKAASDQRAAKGLPTARPGYGYERVDGVDVVIEAEAFVIRDAARRVLASESLRAVAADLNARGIPSPGGAPWQGVTLRQMLRRPSLAGLRTHRGVTVGTFDPDLHPPILDVDTHERLLALFDDPARRHPSGGRTPKHLLSGLAECGLCEKTLGGRMHRLPPWQPKPGSQSKPIKAAYACNQCHKVRRLQAPVDDLVERIIVARLERPDAVDLFTAGDPAAAREARDAIDATDARLALAADQFADGTLTGDQLRRITEKLRARRSELERQLAAALPSQMPHDLVGPRAREVWDGLHIDAKRSVIRALARVIIMPTGTGRSFNPDDVRIDWRAPA